MLTKEKLIDLRDLVWTYRARLNHVWPTPDPLDAMRFASCEAHEALDAWLRLKGGYNRNNDKDLSVENELADCVIMLISSRPVDWIPSGLRVRPGCDLDGICVSVAKTLGYAKEEGGEVETERAIQYIAQYPGMESLEARLLGRLERIEKRVLAHVNQ